MTYTGKFLKKKLLEETTKRFNDIEEMYPSHLYSKATILDPRFKKAAFISNENANTAEQEVQKEIADYIKTNGKLVLYNLFFCFIHFFFHSR